MPAPEKQSTRGGRREGAGRKKGVPNKATAEVREAARKYTVKALKTFVDVMTNGESEQARVMAADKLLDRAYGKPTQVNEHGGIGGGPIETRTLTETERAAKVTAMLQRVAKGG